MSPFRKALPVFLTLAAAFCGSLAAQTPTTPADCIVPASGSASFTAATTGTAYSNSNSFTPCAAWRVTYNATGFSALSIQIETSPDNSSWTAVPSTVCSSSVQPPCVIDGANPTTTTTNATFAVRAYGRYVRLNVTSVTGSGTISTKMYGYKGLSASAGQGSGGGGGSGTVTSVATGCGLSGGTITTSGTIIASEAVNAQTGTTYTVQNADCGKLDTFSNAASVAVTLPQANGSTFVAGWFTELQNRGVGTVTVTPTTSTIDGLAAITLTTGQGLKLVSDGTNYFTQRGMGGPYLASTLGFKLNGTDESTLLSNVWTYWATSGILIQVDCGKTLRADSKLSPPNSGTPNYVQAPFGFIGCGLTVGGGPGASNTGTYGYGGSKLDLRFSGNKIEALAIGSFTLSNITLTSGTADSGTYFYSTGSTPYFTNVTFLGQQTYGSGAQTGIRLGGTQAASSGAWVPNSTTTWYWGGEGLIQGCRFENLNTAIYLGASANGIQIIGNTVTGGNSGTPGNAFDVEGATANPTSDPNRGVVFSGNEIEQPNYACGIKLHGMLKGTLENNSFFDGSSGNAYCPDSTFKSSIVITAFIDSTGMGYSSATFDTTNYRVNSSGVGTEYYVPAGGVFIQPTIADFTNANHTHANAAGGGQLDNTAVKAANQAGSGTKFVMGSALGTSGNCMQWAAAGAADSGTPCGRGSYVNFQTALGNVSSNGTIYTTSIPGGTIGASGCLRIVTNIASVAKGTGNPVWNLVYGSTTIVLIGQPLAGRNAVITLLLCNNAATNAQVLLADGPVTLDNGTVTGWGAGNLGTAAEDSTAAKTLAFTVSGVSGGVNTVTPVYFIVLGL